MASEWPFQIVFLVNLFISSPPIVPNPHQAPQPSLKSIIIPYLKRLLVNRNDVQNALKSNSKMYSLFSVTNIPHFFTSNAVSFGSCTLIKSKHSIYSFHALGKKLKKMSTISFLSCFPSLFVLNKINKLY